MDEKLRQKYIGKISELQDELEKRGVKREKFNFQKMGLVEIREVGTSVSEQLKQRKTFLGEK